MKVIASHNGLEAVRCVYERLIGGAGPLDALVEGVALVEDDPAEQTVGYGGLPNEDGVVELDAAIMDGPLHRAGAVAALQSIRHPTAVARLVMEQTNRVMLVGEGALAFARANGFCEENLLTSAARAKWLQWRQSRSDIDDWLPPPENLATRTSDTGKAVRGGVASSQRLAGSDFDRPTGTVHVAVLTDAGDMYCATSTSGHAFKLPGRVGDSPIVGAGLYVDNGVGTCGSIGWGEANMQNLSSFAAVEAMRRGAAPHEAGLVVLRQLVERTPSTMRNADGRPAFNIRLYTMTMDGHHGGTCLFGPQLMTVADSDGARLEECTPFFDE